VGAYLALMDDRYPATDEHQSVHLDYPYPDAQRDLNRWLPLGKWLLAIPHYVVLLFLWIAALVVVVAWFAIWSPTATRHSVWPNSRDATAVDRGPARQRERGPRPTARRAMGMVQQLDL
jgi:hypothetical protein